MRRRRSYPALVDVVEKRSAILRFLTSASARRKRFSSSGRESAKAAGRSCNSISEEKFVLVNLLWLSLIQSGRRSDASLTLFSSGYNQFWWIIHYCRVIME